MCDHADVRAAWEPATPPEVAELFAGVAVRWWIAGGHAIDLGVGRSLRAHSDIDVLLLREDQAAAQAALAGWEWWAADPPGSLRRWEPGERLPASVHDIWCRPGPGLPWRIQVMLDESDGTDWVSRRDSRIRRPVEALGSRSSAGVPYVVPEVQLYYEAKDPRQKDESDFAAGLEVLDRTQRRWLHDALATTYGGHPWQHRLVVSTTA